MNLDRMAGIVASILVAFAPCAAHAADPNDFQAALDRRTSLAPGVGIVVGIIDHGKVGTYISGSSGNARPLDAHTRFEIGSDTKTFTATLLAIDARSGRVRLNDPLAKFLPKTTHVPGKNGKAITLLELAEQRSGLPRLPSNMTNVEGSDPYADYTRAAMFSFLSGYSLPREPGAVYEYSNFGIGLLGQLLANEAHTTYSALLSARVLKPLGMNETSIAAMPPVDGPPLATGHDPNGVVVPPWHFESIAPAGGIRSDLTDMLKYLRCNMGVGALSADCLFAQQPRADGETGHKIGLVWWTNSATGVVSHGGDTAGFHAEIAVSKDRATGVVVMSNGSAVADIAAHALEPDYPIANCPTSVDDVDTVLTTYRGEYCASGIGLAFHVGPSTVTDTLMIRVEGQLALPYAKTAPDEYTNATVHATATFIHRDGNVVGITFEQNGQSLVLKRLDARGLPL